MNELSSTELHILLNSVMQVVEEASRAVMVIYEKDFEVEYKEDASPLTEADMLANKMICDFLQTLSFEALILSEENTSIPFEERSNYDYVWIIDPIDGTKEFVSKNGDFAIHVALAYKGNVVLSVIAFPDTQSMAWAVKGSGAFLRNNANMTCRLSCTDFTATQEGVRIVASRSHMNDSTKSHIETFHNPSIVRRGSSFKFLMIANGDADYYPRFGPTMEWDSAAPQLILEEAGGSIISMEDGLPLRYNKENLLNPNFTAKGIEC